MVKVKRFGKMENNMKEIIIMIIDMVKVDLVGKMLILRVNLKIITCWKVNMFGMMEENTKDNLKKIKCMVMEKCGGLMENIIKVYYTLQSIYR